MIPPFSLKICQSIKKVYIVRRNDSNIEVVPIVRCGKLDNPMKLLCQNEDDLMEDLSDKQKESFEKFKDCQSEITDYLETEAFTQGFTIAVKLMVEVMKTMEIPEV